MSKHLWEVNHPYYCSESNYYANGFQNREIQQSFSDFDEFLDEWGDADFDYNLLFRWDWEEISQSDYDDLMEDECECDIVPFTGDETQKTGKLKLFFMHQRKGYFIPIVVLVSRSEEQRIREYLQVRYNYFKTLWEPLT